MPSIVHKDIKLAVLMGGPSEEHSISLKSGKGVLRALLSLAMDADAIVIPKEMSFDHAAEFAAQVLKDKKIELAFIALHGPFGEDGQIQSVCESLGIAYTGSDVEASRLGMNKWASRARFIEAGLNVPASVCLEPEAINSALVDELPLPWIIKPIDQGSSIGIEKVDSVDGIQSAVSVASRYGSRLIVESFIRGHELTVGVLGDKVLPVVGIVPKTVFFDFNAKYTTGMTEYEVPAVIDRATADRLRGMARKAHDAIGARHLSRTDFILDNDGKAFVLEVNTVPGFTETSLLPKAAGCIGMNYTSVCKHLVDLAWRSHSEVVVHG